MALFFAFAIGSIYGCAEKPITFAGPGVQIWKLNATYDRDWGFKDQTLVLKPSETEKGVFHVTATIDTETESESKGRIHLAMEWKGEIRNNAMICNITGMADIITGAEEGGHRFIGEAKGTFSKRRASGTSLIRSTRGIRQGKWTAERIS
ncbi:MAG: hypothetical protein ABIE47_13900 [Pseudomonadota bacterium]